MPSAHSLKQYDLDLEQMRSKVLQMGGLVENQFDDALECFRNGNAERAETIMRADQRVNRLEVLLDDDCSHLIVRHQPTANDLRAVMASIKIITDLERVGDEAAKIARAARSMQERGIGISDHGDGVCLMADAVGTLLHDVLDSYARLDALQAARLIARDKAVDHEYRTIMRTLITFMMEDPRSISSVLEILWVTKAVERIGDHAKNIAEYVIYIVEGKDVRHQDMPSSSVATSLAGNA